MTTSAVSQINLFASGQSTVSNVKNESGDSFSQIFASQSETKTEVKTQETTTKTEDVQQTEESSLKEEVKETENVDETKDIEETSEEQVQEIDRERTDEVLSEEEVNAAMGR